MGTLESISGAALPDGLVIALEWPDLDPRLDYRGAGSWSATAVNDIVASARIMLDRIAAALLRIPAGPRIALSLPTLPLPPLFHTPGWQASQHELALEAEVMHFAADIAQEGRIAVINTQRLAEQSPAAGRLDLKSDLYTGLPYTIEHADRLASQLALALVPPVSEERDHLRPGRYAVERNRGRSGPGRGYAGTSQSHAQLHGLYQKLLASLADSGTLIGIASKNDPAVVDQSL